MVYIYILKLEEEKYYIGKTNNPIFRLNEHFNSNASSWTKKYKPLEIVEIISDCDDYDEDKYTKIYMDKYGIDNVRGASYTSINLDKNTKKLLLKSSYNTNNKCFKCGSIEHFYKECPEKNNSDDSDDSDDSDSNDSYNSTSEDSYNSSSENSEDYYTNSEDN
jgi:hypothetical protein